MEPDERLRSWLEPLLREGVEGYYVGGCVRDWLMERPLKDVDLVVAGDPWRIGKAIADSMGAHLFWLREEEQVARVLRPGRRGIQIDLSPLAVPIEADLRARDFTVNAMAVPLAVGLRAGAPILDPTGGREDLRRRRLRVVERAALDRDPLRLMRAVRLSEQLGFTLESQTLAWVRAGAPMLAKVSPERVRDELFLMLAGRSAPRALDRLREYGLLAVFLPEAAAISTEAWGEARERLVRLRRLARRRVLPPAARHRLRKEIVAGRPRFALLEWAVVLRGAGSTTEAWVRETASRIRLGAREAGLLATVLREEGWAAALLREGRPWGRELYRFVRATGGWAVETVVFAATDRVVAEGERSEGVEDRLTRVLEGIRAEEAAVASPLLPGREVMALLGLPPGPAVGEWLDALAEARAERIVTTPDEARAWLLQRAKRRERCNDDRGSHGADAD